jgi:hypothetical protein
LRNLRIRRFSPVSPVAGAGEGGRAHRALTKANPTAVGGVPQLAGRTMSTGVVAEFAEVDVQARSAQGKAVTNVTYGDNPRPRAVTG